MALPRTKLEKILHERSLQQNELIELIYKKTGKKLHPYQVSKIVSGNVIDYMLRTACFIKQALDVNLEDILEEEVLNAKIIQNGAETSE